MLDLLIALALAQSSGAPETTLRCATPDAPDGCPHWQVVHRADIGTGYFDPATIRREGSSVDITTLLVTRDPIEDGANRIVDRFRFDCAAHTFVSLYRTLWTPAGGLVRDGADPDARPEPVVTGSPFDMLLRQHCPGAGGDRR